MFECFVVLDSVALTSSVLAVIMLIYGKASHSIARGKASWQRRASSFFSLISSILALYVALVALPCTIHAQLISSIVCSG